MKVQNIFQKQAILIGLGATLLLASSAPAQEIVNTSFDDGPTCVAFSQPAPAPLASDLNLTSAGSETVSPAAMIATPVMTEDATVSVWSSLEVWVIASLLVCISLVSLYALAEAKRANRNLNALHNSQITSRTALS